MSTTPSRRRATPLHLLWAIPIALAGTWIGAMWVTLSWCGLFGCSGGGWGRISNPSVVGAVTGAGFIAVVWFALLGGAPWHPSQRVRMIVGALVGLVLAWLTANMVTDGFSR